MSSESRSSNTHASDAGGLRPSPPQHRGRLERFTLRSSILLQQNPLDDPAEREVIVYLPAAYDLDRDRRFPVIWSLAAYTSSGQAQVAWRNHGENLQRRLDRLIDQRQLAPAIFVMYDSYTSLGGNQFVDSPAIGNHASHLVHELVPAVDQRYRTIPEAAARGVFGKSSGGFGAIHVAVNHPGVFAAVASHAGDCGFDRVYARDFAACCDELAIHDGDPVALVRAFWRARKPSHRAFHALMVLCLAASYSPCPGNALNLELPFDRRTARLEPDVWRRWLDFDPVGYGRREFDALSELRGLWIDAGSRDQYYIHYGTRELHDHLVSAKVSHHYEEFDGNHSGMDWRFDQSLPWLLSRLKHDDG